MRNTAIVAALAAGLLSASALAQQAPSPAPAPAAPPAQASKNCKDIVTAKARSAAQLSDASRERIARQNAIDNWRRRVRDTYGWRYRFWSRAQDRQVNCGGGASAKHCTATARPCRLL
jgi:hypothetical protein